MEISRRFSFSAGHTIYKHKGKCHNLHGHNYEGAIIISGQDLDDMGMLMDFSVIKKIIMAIDTLYDHKFFIWSKDPRSEVLKDLEGVVVCNHQPTVENFVLRIQSMCEDYLFNAHGGSGHGFIPHVLLYETEDCYARA